MIELQKLVLWMSKQMQAAGRRGVGKSLQNKKMLDSLDEFLVSMVTVETLDGEERKVALTCFNMSGELTFQHFMESHLDFFYIEFEGEPRIVHLIQ